MIVHKIIRFAKDWALPLSMIVGVLSYFVGCKLNLSNSVTSAILSLVKFLQPALLFCMLFVSFCKIDPKKIRLSKWHLWLSLIQILSFVALAFISHLFKNENVVILLECAMLCMICPTATAAVVIVDKLGGNSLSLIAYTITSNIFNAIIVPIIIPFVNPAIHTTFLQAFGIIMSQIFPLLVFPFLLAWAVRLFLPNLLKYILQIKDLAFYMWIVALILALAVTTRALVNSNITIYCFIGIAIITFLACMFQFYIGKKIGSKYNDRISAGQALGQKSTVYIIWMGYTFMNPITAVAGGFYSIWHNMVNSYQLYKNRKLIEEKK